MRTIIVLTTFILSFLVRSTFAFTTITIRPQQQHVSFVTTSTITTTTTSNHNNDFPNRIIQSSKSSSIQQLATPTTQRSTMALQMSEPTSSDSTDNKRPFWFDPNTKGGALVLMVVLFVVPVLVYNILVSVGGVDEIEAGITIGIGFTVISTVAWVSTYVFRVATKDMTYVS